MFTSNPRSGKLVTLNDDDVDDDVDDDLICFFCSELLEVTHIRTIYNIFVSLLVVFFLNTIVYDYIDNGR